MLNRSGPSGGDGGDDQAVARRDHQREDDAVGEQAEPGERVQADPVSLGPGALEHRVHRELVRDAEGDGDIGGQVDRVPQLVGQVLANAEQGRGESDGQQQAERDDGQGVVTPRPQLRELVQEGGVGAHRIAPREQHAVCQDTTDNPRPQAGVLADRLVLAEQLLDEGDAGGQEHHHAHQVGADQASEDAGGLHRVLEAVPTGRAAVGEVDGEDHRDGRPPDQADGVASERTTHALAAVGVRSGRACTSARGDVRRRQRGGRGGAQQGGRAHGSTIGSSSMRSLCVVFVPGTNHRGPGRQSFTTGFPACSQSPMPPSRCTTSVKPAATIASTATPERLPLWQ